jgi:N-acetylmuramic acid 6-phosphate etherase
VRLPASPDVSDAGTEARDPRFDGVDQWPVAAVLDGLLEGQMAALAAVRGALPALAQVIEAALPRLRAGGRLAYASGRVAFQDGAELRPTFGWPEDRLVYLLAGGREALYRAVEGAEDGWEVGAADAAGLGPNDVLLAVAASGTTPYTRAAVQAARSSGCLTVGIANNHGAPLLADAEIGVLVPTGPEPVAGSTRLKAGTAQKVVLNMISTGLMIRLGHVYRGWMVDMIASNEKLRRRAERMVAAITGDGEAAVRQALAAADGNVKVAVLLLSGLTVEAARATLAASGGHLRQALPRDDPRQSGSRR